MEEYEKIYFDEFQHSIIDLGEKVTITTLSDKYERPISEISSALSKWVETQQTKNLRKEFILRGIRKNGQHFITVVPEEKLQKAKESVKNAYFFVYSVETSSSSPSLDLIKLSAVKKKNLILPEDVVQKKVIESDEHMDQGESSKVIMEEPVIKAPKKNSNDFFKNKSSEKKDSDKVKVENEKQDTSKSEKSPKKPEVKPTANKKASPVKGKANKGSIASFFSAKPTTAVKTEQKSNNEIETKSEDRSNNNKDIENSTKKAVEDTPRYKNINKKGKEDLDEVENTSKKRPLEDSDTKKQGKSAKKQKTVSAGRRRIIVDSSDEENIADNEPEPELEPKLEPEPELQRPIQVEVKEESEEMEVVEAKPLGPMTYQDEDGFLVTVMEKKPPPKKVEKAAPIKKNLTKLDKVPVKAATKQGSIRNFFMKK